MSWKTSEPPQCDWYRLEYRCRNCGNAVLMFNDYIGEGISRTGYLEKPCDCFQLHGDGHDQWRLYD